MVCKYFCSLVKATSLDDKSEETAVANELKTLSLLQVAQSFDHLLKEIERLETSVAWPYQGASTKENKAQEAEQKKGILKHLILILK